MTVLLKSYSDWISAFERFGKGDDSVTEQMNAGSFTLDAGTAKRYCLGAEEAYKARKLVWLENFQRSFQLQAIRNENYWSIYLRNGKQSLWPLLKFVSAKGLPEDLRNTLRGDLIDFVAEVKKSLKDNLLKTGAGKEKMLTMLTAFGLPEAWPEKDNRQGDSQIAPEESVSKGRKIIFCYGK